MLRYSTFLTILAILMTQISWAQKTVEREHRITKAQFPETARSFISKKLVNPRKMRYYKEIDSSGVFYMAKFRKDRLHYSIGFDGEGKPKEINILIGEVDIPSDALATMKEHLHTSFKKYRIRNILQKYALNGGKPLDTTLRNAFQNLLIPDLLYEILVAGKKNKFKADYVMLFDSEGNLISEKASLPVNYDHVLY